MNVAVGGISEQVTQPDPSDTRKIRAISGVQFTWPQQIVCSSETGCEMGPLKIHSGQLLGGHGGCEDVDAELR